MDIGRRAVLPMPRSVAIRRIAACVAALAMIAATSRPAPADGLIKDDAAKVMVLLLSLHQALAQKGGSAPSSVKPEAKPVPVAAADKVSGAAVGASDSANAAVEGASTPPADR